MIRLVMIQGNVAARYIGRIQKGLWQLDWSSETEITEKLADIETVRRGDES